MESITIRSKLRNGTTIQQICTEYDLTFNELILLMRQLGDEKNRYITNGYSRTGQLYITERNGRYYIRKSNRWFGTYKTLDDAVKIRDWFKRNGKWDKRWVDRACKECEVTQCQK